MLQDRAITLKYLVVYSRAITRFFIDLDREYKK